MDAATCLASVPAASDSIDQARLIADLEAQNQNLRAALATRDLIWSAKVMIAAATGCGPAEAHDLLIKQSQHENRKVSEIAATIVERA